jgi:hypothetical protein
MISSRCVAILLSVGLCVACSDESGGGGGGSAGDGGNAMGGAGGTTSTTGGGGSTQGDCDPGAVTLDADQIFTTYAGTYTVELFGSCDVNWQPATSYTLTVGASPKSIAVTSDTGQETYTWDDTDDRVCQASTVVAQIQDGMRIANFVVSNDTLMSVSLTDMMTFTCTLRVQ